jgi:hypothetical protein
MNALGRHLLTLREIKQLPQRVLSAFRLNTGYTKVVAAATDLHVQPGLQQAQILVQWAAQIREPGIVRRLEIEFARG